LGGWRKGVTVLADSVEGFFSGIRSSVGRLLLALLAILAGFGVCLVSSGWYTEAGTIWGILTVGVLFWWATYGGWFLIGLLSFIGMFAFALSFVYDWHPKLSFFGVFASAVVYYSPLTFSEYRWLYVLGLCIGIGFCYWVLPYVLGRAIRRKAQLSDEPNADTTPRRLS
jgi:hypothetical protein